MFQLIIDEQPINLKWGTRAMKLLCDRMGIDMDGFFGLLDTINKGEATSDQMFIVVENFLMAGYQYANGTPTDENIVCEWIDKCGGVFKINQGQLIQYINYVIHLTFNGVTPLNGELGEKKKTESPEAGTTY